jgi:hypothetical protein
MATAPPLYIRNTASDRCCIILTGHVKIVAGEEGFESECGAWTILGISATQQSVYMPDFTAKVKGPDSARVMYITATEFRNFIQGKRVPRRSFDQSFVGTDKSGPLDVRRQRRQRGAGKSPTASQSGRSSPASISHSEDDDEDEEQSRSKVTRLETVTSPSLAPAQAPVQALALTPGLQTVYDGDTSTDSPSRSPPAVALPSPRPSEAGIFRLHSVEKDPYRENQSAGGQASGDDSTSAKAPGSGQKPHT